MKSKNVLGLFLTFEGVPKRIKPLLEALGLESTKGYFSNHSKESFYTAWNSEGQVVAIFKKSVPSRRVWELVPESEWRAKPLERSLE